MISIDQIKILEVKVKQAVQLIIHLRRENDHLRSRLADTEVKLQELENVLQAFQDSQGEIDEGIKNAIEYLDDLDKEEDIQTEDAPATVLFSEETSSSSDLDFEKESSRMQEPHPSQQGLGIF